MNALAGHQRAIVHPTPGTTRDAVTELTAIDGWPVELCDTAGLRATDDPIERAGIERAQSRLASADLVVLVCDASLPWSAEDQALLAGISQEPNKMTTVCHCFAEAVPIAVRCPALLASKQWHSAFWSTTRAICQ